jgi:hypothetical protein
MIEACKRERCPCEGFCTGEKTAHDSCPRCGEFKTPDRRNSMDVCWACDTWMEIDALLSTIDAEDPSPLAIEGLIIEMRDRLFLSQ